MNALFQTLQVTVYYLNTCRMNQFLHNALILLHIYPSLLVFHSLNVYTVLVTAHLIRHSSFSKVRNILYLQYFNLFILGILIHLQ